MPTPKPSCPSCGGVRLRHHPRGNTFRCGNCGNCFHAQEAITRRINKGGGANHHKKPAPAVEKAPVPDGPFRMAEKRSREWKPLNRPPWQAPIRIGER